MIRFEKETHEYFIDDLSLSGITKVIGKRVNKVFDGARDIPKVSSACEFGSQAHEEIEMYIKEGREIIHPSLSFVQEFIEEKYPITEYARYSEYLVSDYKKYATAIDLVFVDKNGVADIYDLKTGVFYREYCSWQLGVCKMFLEYPVRYCGVISLKDKRIYKIIPKTLAQCKGLFK